MRLIPLAAGLLCALHASAETPQPHPFLLEPEYIVEKQATNWALRKASLHAPAGRIWTVYEHRSRTAVAERGSELPALRLARQLVEFDPATRTRTAVEDWTAEPDAREIEHDVLELIGRFAAPAVREAVAATPVYMARLRGASGHTSEEPDDYRRFVIYIDPHRATGRLHAAATLVHELAHVERYRTRGFHANRAAAVLSRRDFILLGAADELAAYETEASFIRAFIASLPDPAQEPIRHTMRSRTLRWPAALLELLGPDPAGQTVRTREQIVLDIHRQASAYWELHRHDLLNSPLRATLRRWYSESLEWAEIAGQRAHWAAAGAVVE